MIARIDRDGCYEIIDNTVFQIQKHRRRDHGQLPGSIGLEMEMLAVRNGNGQLPEVVPFFSASSVGLREILQPLAGDGKVIDDFSVQVIDNSILKLTMIDGDNLTFEPGGQIEYSSRCYDHTAEAVSAITANQQTIVKLLRKHAIELFAIGINPWHTVDQIGLQIAKPHYLALDSHFTNLGSQGQRMMRQTCTNQVNLDFGTDQLTMAKRYLAANYIAPYAAAIFANSGVWEGNLSTMLGFRTAIWRETDSSRTGVADLSSVERNLTKRSCVDSYFEFAMQAQVIRRGVNGITFDQWLTDGIDGQYPTVNDFQNHLYTLFPEVRPRGRYLELRSLDSQAFAWQFVPLTFYVSLLYRDQALDQVIDRLATNDWQGKMKLACRGLAVDDRQFVDRAKWLMELAISGITLLPALATDNDCRERLARFYEFFTLKGKSPASDIQTVMQNSGRGYLSIDDLRRLQELWNDNKEIDGGNHARQR